jgi:hypothetical protein
MPSIKSFKLKDISGILKNKNRIKMPYWLIYKKYIKPFWHINNRKKGGILSFLINNPGFCNPSIVQQIFQEIWY